MPNIYSTDTLPDIHSLLKEVDAGGRVYLSIGGKTRYAVVAVEELDELDLYRLESASLQKQRRKNDLAGMERTDSQPDTGHFLHVTDQ